MAISRSPRILRWKCCRPAIRAVWCGPKIKHYIDTQVKLVWLVDPEAKTVTVYPGQMIGTELDETAMLDGGDVLSGFSYKVADLFSTIGG